jgi:hypothetical protein
VHSFRGRKCTRKHSEEACTRVQRREVHTYALRGERCTAHTCAQRREVHTTRAEDGSECKRNHKKEGSARTCTQSRKLHAYAPRSHKCTMRGDWSSICPTNAVPQGRRCSTCPEGGDASCNRSPEEGVATCVL